jgi:hypothetical protein
MATNALSEEQANWLRGLLNSNPTNDEGINHVAVLDDVRDALIEMQFVRQQPDYVEVTDQGLDAMWRYTLSQRIKSG